MDTDVEALVVGGAAAGLSSALVLGRARVKTLVVDGGKPSNRTAAQIGGLLGHSGTSPAQFYTAGREQVTSLPTVELHPGVVSHIEKVADEDEPAFAATLADGDSVVTRRVLFAIGMHYQIPDTPGLAELWGTRAFMCPYCHGWEHRDQKIGILGGSGVEHRVALLSSWSDDLVVLADGDLPPEERDRLIAAGVPVVEQPITALAPGVVSLADGNEVEVDAIHVVAPMAPRDGLAAKLGVASTDSPMGMGFITADGFGATSVPGAFAAGDVAGGGNVATAIAGGSLAGTGLHRSLIDGLSQ